MSRLPSPFPAGPHRFTMGLQRLDLRDWLDLEARAWALPAKQCRLSERFDDVVGVLPGSEAAGAEVLDLVRSHLGLPAPPAEDGSEHPLVTAARLVAEDLCVMQDDADGTSRLTAACVCFPSRWRLADKLGASVAAIHDPVPTYDTLARPVDRYLATMPVDRPTVRFNWTLLDDAEPFQPSPAARRPSAGPPSDVGRDIVLRVERQTLRRLPRTGAVLFTIGTRIDPLGALDADDRTRLAAALADVDDAVAAYKGWTALLPAVREWVRTAS